MTFTYILKSMSFIRSNLGIMHMRFYLLSIFCFLYLITTNPLLAQTKKPKTNVANVATTTEYKTLRLLAKYLEEEKEGVHYFRGKDQKFYHVTFKDGLLYQRKQLVNASYSPPKDLNTNIQIPSNQPLPVDAKKSGYAIYVMDAQGEFYLSFEGQKGKFHHSSFLAGQPVACAGEMIIFQGKIFLINNQSGHYQPPPLALDQALDSLKKHGIDLEKIKVDRYGFDF